MKQNLIIKNSGTLICIFCLIFFSCLRLNGQQPDKKMVDKYGLTIPSPSEKMDSAPDWVLNSDMFTSGGRLWEDYKFSLKDTMMNRIVRMRASYGKMNMTEYYPVETIGSFNGSLLKGVPLISHVPHSQKAFEEAHKQGFRVVPYVHFWCIHTNYADQDVFFFQHPEVAIKDADGKWAHAPMSGTDRAFRFLTCPNSPSYWQLSLAYVKKIMDMGADGIFIDNVGRRQPCMAEEVVSENPEFNPYVHEHLFPDATQDYADDQMLQAIRALVKSYGEDKIVILNIFTGTDPRFMKSGDACMWEKFYNTGGRQDTWEDVKKRAQTYEWYLDAGRKITASSSIGRSGGKAKDDAFWAFSAARLVDFLWWASLNGSGAEVLYQAHMGKGLEHFKEMKGIAYRTFENGLIVLNDGLDDQDVELTLPAGFQPRRLLDLYNDSRIINVKNQKVKVTVPKKSARVYFLSLNQ